MCSSDGHNSPLLNGLMIRTTRCQKIVKGSVNIKTWKLKLFDTRYNNFGRIQQIWRRVLCTYLTTKHYGQNMISDMKLNEACNFWMDDNKTQDLTTAGQYKTTICWCYWRFVCSVFVRVQKCCYLKTCMRGLGQMTYIGIVLFLFSQRGLKPREPHTAFRTSWTKQILHRSEDQNQASRCPNRQKIPFCGIHWDDWQTF